MATNEMFEIDEDEDARLAQAITDMKRVINFLEMNDGCAVNFVDRIERVAGELGVIEDKVMEVVSDYSDYADHSLYPEDD